MGRWAHRGEFDDGWGAARERILAAQKAHGVMPESVQLPPGNPGVPTWEELPEEDRHAYARMMEVYAGFLAHFDAHLDLLDLLETTGQL